MELQYYIASSKYTVQERKTKKHGTVYDVVFRITDKITLEEKQKRLSGFKTKKLAHAAYTDFTTKYCEVIKNIPRKRKIDLAKEIPTISELVKQYLAALPNQIKESSIYDKIKIFNKFILPRYGEKKITILTKDELYRFQDDLWSMINPKTGKSFSYNYLCKIRTHFSAFLSWTSTRYGYPNYFDEIKRPKKRKPKTIMQFWTRDEFEQFIKVVDNPTYHCLFTMMFFTGRRIGEIYALTPKDIRGTTINFDKSITRKTLDGSPYKITSTKADKTALVPICKTVQNELKNYAAQSPFLFGGDKPLSHTTTERYFKKWCVQAEVKQIRLHDLRHSFVSMLIHLGANLTVVADLISDTVEQVTETYGHMYESDKADLINKLN